MLPYYFRPVSKITNLHTVHSNALFAERCSYLYVTNLYNHIIRSSAFLQTAPNRESLPDYMCKI